MDGFQRLHGNGLNVIGPDCEPNELDWTDKDQARLRREDKGDTKG
jgi:hypothetical protein